RLYGLSPKQMVRGDSICMDCHGSFESGRETRKVQDGVSCQSCHGPAADYVEIHQEGDESLGRERTGYQKAIKVGMKDLYERTVRVKNCASCHYITDPRLISSGHPTGVDFDVAAGLEKIRHWQRPADDAGAVKTAWAAELAQRGPVPTVRLARLAETETLPGAAPAAGSRGASAGAPSRPRRAQVFSPRPQRGGDVRGTARAPGSDAEVGDVPPMPEIEENAPISEILQKLQAQLKRLYEAVAGGGS
ncbi:MAG: multiheme c-type cytochrome, partial [Acidobacteriota bacterium]